MITIGWISLIFLTIIFFKKAFSYCIVSYPNWWSPILPFIRAKRVFFSWRIRGKILLFCFYINFKIKFAPLFIFNKHNYFFFTITPFQIAHNGLFIGLIPILTLVFFEYNIPTYYDHFWSWIIELVSIWPFTNSQQNTTQALLIWLSYFIVKHMNMKDTSKNSKMLN